jgi:hypothetical protein
LAPSIPQLNQTPARREPSLHELDEKFRLASRALEHASQHLADAKQAFSDVPGNAAAKFCREMFGQIRAANTARANLTILIERIAAREQSQCK